MVYFDEKKMPVVAWVSPPNSTTETEAPPVVEEESQVKRFLKAAAVIGVGVVGVVGVAVVGAGLLASALAADPGFPGSGPDEKNEEKLMKAPGQPPLKIRRKDFEENPKVYFSTIRDVKKAARHAASGSGS